ncbi:MAG: AEC family transporter [Micavibrio sp.]
MDIIALLTVNIIPLYLLVAAGYVAGRWMDVNLHSMAIIAIYFLAPLVNFGAMMNLDFNPAYTILPLVVLAGSVSIGCITYYSARKRWSDNSANLIAMSSVTGNTGYFGFPIILALFDPHYAGIYLLINTALLVSEAGLGYYFGARGNAGIKGAILKVIKLPVIHAIWIGLLLNMLGVEPADLVIRYTDYATGAWVIIGMMLIGIALGKQEKILFEPRLIKWLFTAKFILWPAFGAIVITADRLFFHLFDGTIHAMLAILCAVPLAGNLVAYAAALHLRPERVAGAVLASTLLALFTVPLALMLVRLYENF